MTMETTTPVSGILRKGATGDEVRTLQAALGAAGFPVRVDGDFGEETETAVKKFQKKRGLDPDGEVGPKTAAGLLKMQPFTVATLGPRATSALECPADAPAWLKAAWKEIGTREEAENKGPAVRRYIALAHAGAEGQPWCAIFANAMLEASGIYGTRSASSQSFASSDNFRMLSGPALGAIAVFWRGIRSAGLGHVGFYCGERDRHVWTLGGNEADRVQIEMLPKGGPGFGLRGYWWPRSEPPPKIAAIEVSATVPSHVVSVT